MRTQKNLKDIFVILVLLILITVFFFPVAILQKTFITTGLIQSDLMNHSYPLKATYGDALKKGKLLLWSSLIGNGYPVFAEGQTGGLYPINLLLFKFLPNLQAYNFSLLIHYFMAAFFTYLFVRKILGLGRTPGLLAALTYALSGFFMTHLVHPAMIQVASFIPLNFLLVERIIQSARGTWQRACGKKSNAPPATCYMLLLAVAFTLQSLAGHHELSYFTIVFLFIYLFIRNLQIYKERLLRPFLLSTFYFLLSGIFALGLSAIQILPTLELTKFSTRKIGLSYQETTSYLLPLFHLLTFIKPKSLKFSETVDYTSQFPDAVNLWETYRYVGILPLALAGLTTGVWITNFVKKNRNAEKGKGKREKGKGVNFTPTFVILFAISLLLALGRATPFFKLFWLVVPGMKFFKYPTRFLVFTEFSLAILAGIGFEQILTLTRNPRKTRFARHGAQKLRYNKITGLLGYWVTGLLFLDLFINNRPINPTTDPKTWFQPPPIVSFLNQNLGHNRFHALRTTPFDYPLIENPQDQFELKNLLPANFNLLYQLRQTDTLTGLLLSRHSQLNQEIPNSRLSLDTDTLVPPPVWIRIISLQAAKFLLSPIPFRHPALKLVETIPLAKPLTFNIYLLTKSGQEHERIPVTNIYIYENSQGFPRAFIVPNSFITSENEKGILKLLSTQDINFKETVLLEEKPETMGNGKWEMGNGKFEVEIIEDANEKVVISTKSEEPGFLVLADTFYPGWRAFVDGVPTKIYRANFNFRAIVLPKGEHRVEFVYQPLSFQIGGMITLITGGLIVLFPVLRKRIKIKISN